MNNMAVRISDYCQAVYHNSNDFRAAAVSENMRLEDRPAVGRPDSRAGWFEPYLPPPFSPDHPSVLKWICNQHLQGVVYRHIKENGPSSSGSDSLKQAYYGVLFNNIRIQSVLEELEFTLAGKNISILIFKGAALMAHAYPDPGMRPMDDIDMLARPENLPEIKQALGDAGCRRDATFSGMFFKNGVCIDLHGHFVHADRLAGRKAVFSMDMDRVWRDSLPWRPGYDHIRMPCDADHLIILSHHMIKHSFSKWIWLYDAWLLLKNYEPADWREFARKTRQYRQERPVSVMLYIMDRVFNLRAPAGLPFADWVKQLSFLEKVILDVKVRGGDMADLGNLLWLFCIKNNKQRLLFLREAVVGSVAAQSSRLTQPVTGDKNHVRSHPRFQQLQRIYQNLKVLVKGLSARL